MSKITKKDLLERIEFIESWMNGADNMLTELNHALPDPEYDAKCEAQEADVDASLDRHRERLGLNKPQLKQLDQSIFDGLDEKWRFAMVSSVGAPFVYDYKPTGNRVCFSDDATQEKIKAGKVMRIDEYDYDTTDWQNSLIERDIAKELLEVDLSSELTGSDLCVAMLLRLDKYVMCMTDGGVDVIHDLACLVSSTHPFIGRLDNYKKVTPINNQGEPLTAAEVGL